MIRYRGRHDTCSDLYRIRRLYEKISTARVLMAPRFLLLFSTGFWSHDRQRAVTLLRELTITTQRHGLGDAGNATAHKARAGQQQKYVLSGSLVVEILA